MNSNVEKGELIMTRKILCLVLTLIFTLALATNALAADTLDLLSVRVFDAGYLSVIAGTDFITDADLNFKASTENGDLDIGDTVVLRNEGTSWFVVLEYGYYGDSEPLIRTQNRIMQRISEMIGDKDEGALVETQVSPSILMENAGNFRDSLTRKHQKKKEGAKQLGATVRTVMEYIGNNQEKLKPNVAMIIVTACPDGQVTDAMIQDIGDVLNNYNSVSTHIIVTAGGNVHTKDRPLGQKLIDKAKLTVGGTGYMTNQLTADEGERGVKRISDAERRKVLMVLDAKSTSVLGHTLTVTQKTAAGKEMKVDLKLPDGLYDLWMEGVKTRVPGKEETTTKVVPISFGPVGSSSIGGWVNPEYNPPTQPAGMSTELLIGIIIGAVVLALLAVLLIVRLRKGGNKNKKSASVIYGTNTSSSSGKTGTTVILTGVNGAVLKGQIKNGKLTIGRNGAKAMLSVPNDGKLSGLHATFTKQGNSLLITDNGSTNGTKVNGNKISANVPTTLQQNDTVTMGSTTYTITWR